MVARPGVVIVGQPVSEHDCFPVLVKTIATVAPPIPPTWPSGLPIDRSPSRHAATTGGLARVAGVAGTAGVADTADASAADPVVEFDDRVEHAASPRASIANVKKPMPRSARPPLMFSKTPGPRASIDEEPEPLGIEPRGIEKCRQAQVGVEVVAITPSERSPRGVQVTHFNAESALLRRTIGRLSVEKNVDAAPRSQHCEPGPDRQLRNNHRAVQADQLRLEHDSRFERRRRPRVLVKLPRQRRIPHRIRNHRTRMACRYTETC